MGIEHSFAGDLGFTLICPNGHSMVIDGNDHSGGSYLGQANDHDSVPACDPNANPPGIPWTYCWSALYQQQGYLNTLDAGQSPIPATDTLTHTNYFTPDNPFSQLLGCPINGTWNLQIKDNWGIDNGYIFWWELQLPDPASMDTSWLFPNHGANNGVITIDIVGNTFQHGATVKLTKMGQAALTPANISMVDTVNNYSKISASFSFNNESIGLWNVVVTNPDSSIVTFTDGFNMEPTIKSLWVDIVGPSFMRPEQAAYFVIPYGNSGNVDVSSPEIVIWFPKECRGKLSVSLTDTAFLMDSLQLQPLYSSDSIGFLAILPKLRFGDFGQLYLQLTAPLAIDSLLLNVRIADNIYMPDVSVAKANPIVNNPNSKDPLFNVCSKIYTKKWPISGGVFGLNHYETDHPIIILPVFDNQGNVIDSTAFTQESTQWNDHIIQGVPATIENTFSTYHMVASGCTQLPQSDIDSLRQKYNLSGITYHQEQPFKNEGNNRFDAIGILEYWAEQCSFNNGNGFIPNSLESNNYEGDLWRSAFNMGQRNNIIILGQDNFMKKKRMVTGKYKNVPVNYPQDPNEKAGPTGFGSQHYIIPGETLNYMIHFENLDNATASAQDIIVIDTLDANVDWKTFSMDGSSHIPSDLQIDTVHGIIKWIFNGINLLPNVTPPEGEAWILYHVNQNNNLSTGTQIRNKASITFDVNQPMITNEWINIIDRGVPESAVKLQTTYLDSTSYRIYWSGNDDFLGSGIKEYSVYYSDNLNNPYCLLIKTTDSSTVFTGIKDSTYYFYSIASDNVGHIESPPASYDLELKTIDITGVSELGQKNGYNIFPNPATETITIENISFIKTESIFIYNQQGQLILKRSMQDAKTSIDISSLSNGLYLIKISNLNGFVVKKFLKQ
ncbi:MAG: T9SS type A sorting domain-containing protein [Bacteroidota bacterium]